MGRIQGNIVGWIQGFPLGLDPLDAQDAGTTYFPGHISSVGKRETN